MRTHKLQNGNEFKSDAFPPQEGEDVGGDASGAGDSDDTITLTNGNVFKSSAFPQQEEEPAAAPAAPKAPKAPRTRRQPTWDLQIKPEEYLKQEGLDASLSTLALVTLGLTREEYEELQVESPPAPASGQTPAPVVTQPE